VFIDETAVSTNMVRLRGRAPRGVRVIGAVPLGKPRKIAMKATCVGWGLQASHETGHDDDGQDLHRPLHANYKKEITQLILAMSGSGRRNWMQTHKLVGSR
jgi:hypothetical protein